MPRFVQSVGSQRELLLPRPRRQVLQPEQCPLLLPLPVFKTMSAGMLSYFLIPALIFLVMEPYNRNRFIRFHAFQGIFYSIAWFVAGVIAGFLPILNLLLIPLVGLAFLIGWVILAVKAFQGQKFKLPVIGELAEKQANQ